MNHLGHFDVALDDAQLLVGLGCFLQRRHIEAAQAFGVGQGRHAGGVAQADDLAIDCDVFAINGAFDREFGRFVRVFDHPRRTVAVGQQEAFQEVFLGLVSVFGDHEEIARHIQIVAHINDVDLAQSPLLAHQQARVGGGGGVHLTLDQGREIEQAGDHDGDIGFFQPHLLQQYQQVLSCAAGEAVDANFFALEVGGFGDVAAFQ